MRVVLNRLIFEDASMDLAEAAADALLPLIMCEQEAFQRTVRRCNLKRLETHVELAWFQRFH